MAEPSYAKLQAAYRSRWNQAVLKNDRYDRDGAVKRFVARILANRERYEAVEAKTGVPWYFIAVTHMRESSCNFAGVLHNGQHIIGTGRKTTLVPKGRGPFSSWEEAAIDALRLKGLHRIKAWPIERTLYECERFNGWGYHFKGRPSPYVWAGTQFYIGGKYVADGVYSASHIDSQLGVAIVLKKLAANGVLVDPQPKPTPSGPRIPLPVPEAEDPEVESPRAEDFETKPAIKSKSILAGIGGLLSLVLSYATDWRVLTALAAIALLFMIADRYLKLDIHGWFR